MSHTIFYNKNGGMSSVRTSAGTKDKKVYMTSYIGSNDGGVTFKNKYTTTRINNRGQVISHGINSGRKTTYYGSNSKEQSRIASFK